MTSFATARRPGRFAFMAVVAALVLPGLAVDSTRAAAGQYRVGANNRMGSDSLPNRAPDGIGLAVNPADPSHVVAITTQVIGGHCEFHVSRNGGKTWTSGRLRAPSDSGFPGALCRSGPSSANIDGAGSIAFGGGSTVYATFAAPRSQQGLNVLVARSRNGGASYETAVVAIPGTDGSYASFSAAPKIAVRSTSSGDELYVIASRAPVTRCAHSIRLRVGPASVPNRCVTERPAAVVAAVSRDGGQSWSAPRVVNDPAEAAIEPSQPVVDPSGAVYVGWRTNEDNALPNYLVVAKSTDGGDTWVAVRAARVRGYTQTRATEVTPGSFSVSSYPRLAVDRDNGTLYLVYGQGPNVDSVTPQDHFIHSDSDVLLVRSTDAGANWSAPVRVNDDPIGNDISQRHPNITVAPNGRVDVVWHDRRHGYRAPTHTHYEGTEARLGDTYYAYSLDGGQTFSVNRRITDRSINNDVGLDYKCCNYWAYGPVSAPLGNDEVLFAWMDSREGSVDNDISDIYLAHLTFDGSAPAGVRRHAAPSKIERGVLISRLGYQGGGEAVLADLFSSKPWSKVVIVNEDDVSAALAGSVLARANLGPLLASPASGLPTAVREEIIRIAPIGAILVGGTDKLSPSIRDELVTMGIQPDQVTRIAGATAAETAALVANAMDKRPAHEQLIKAPAFDAAVLVNPEAPDAAAATALAASRRLPILLTDKMTVPDATRSALDSLGIRETLVIGGGDYVSDAVLVQAPGAKRLAGATPTGTSEAVIVESLARGMPSNVVYAIDDASPVEAAMLGAALGRATALLVLADGGSSEQAKGSIARLGLTPLVDHIVTIGDSL